jgi:hypothetical protein
MDQYILKIGEMYVTFGNIRMGVPPMTSDIGKAIKFTQTGYSNYVQRICLTPEIIKI